MPTAVNIQGEKSEKDGATDDAAAVNDGGESPVEHPAEGMQRGVQAKSRFGKAGAPNFRLNSARSEATIRALFVAGHDSVEP